MKMGFFGVMLSAALTARADTITLNTWNVDAIQDSGDIVTIVIGTHGDGNVTATFQWSEGDSTDDLWSAIGLDTIFYNSDSDVVAVLDQDGTDITGDWHLHDGNF